ncbi:hypothetical protein Lalb_Chr02g0154761 [Lupinus albus]|uniref:Uncharacterized protein n=1 Tax=Lupinus albus TaxID=3870 RepID=A0A6A4R0L4_LUPAL|nr:hypothetical protein Lalb_Chr02g0154761 [Lupinus albus]
MAANNQMKKRCQTLYFALVHIIGHIRQLPHDQPTWHKQGQLAHDSGTRTSQSTQASARDIGTSTEHWHKHGSGNGTGSRHWHW